MPRLRPQTLIGTPNALTRLSTADCLPIGPFRSLSTSSANHVVQIAPGVRYRQPDVVKKYVRIPYQPRRGVGTKSSWEQWQSKYGQPKRSNASGVLAVLFGASAVAVFAAPATSWVKEQTGDKNVDDSIQIDEPEDDQHDDTQMYRLAEVAKHDQDAESQWIVKGTNVYDITDFVAAHPGGKVILRACGGSIDPYWKLFTIHNKPEVQQILDDFYIGEIDPQDLDADGKIDWSILGNDSNAIEDPFKDDPERDADLIVQTAKPCNAETPGKLLVDFLTPLRLFFVRNHLWVPRIDPEEHQLQIELSDGEELSYSIEDLKKRFSQHTVTVTLQCAGNRRCEMNDASNGKTSGLAWSVGAIGTADFTGVRLRDVLRASGYDVENACTACPDDPEADRHIHFCAPSDTYEQSIPLQTALNPASDVLLAWEMNGEPMPRDHGGPLRAIVPGSVATRSVKWVERVRISCDESSSNWHNRDYKCFGPNVRAADLCQKDWDEAQSIQELPVQSAITNIARSNAKKSPVSVQGFAYSGGGRRIVRVDVSADGGKTWKQADLKKDDAKGTRRWAWTLWNIDWSEDEVPQGAEFVVKAVDEAHNCQPQTMDGIWNFRGLLGNAWHRVSMGSQNES